MRLPLLSALTGAALIAWTGIAVADARLPLRDGAYADSSSQCAVMRRGDSDGAAYSVEKSGRMISGPEQACLIASIRRLRPDRYHVQTDCREFDELYRQSFFLDVLSPERFRLDGEQYQWCVALDGDGVMLIEPQRESPASTISVQKLSNKALIDYWAKENEGCRGGPGDAPETYEACGRRQTASDELSRRKLCFKPHKGTMDWVRCR